ncbi:Vacuolar biogenesis protein END1 [Giardia duodenalis assemblage B]|uniref:Vacuolar biogenesis protein END1 n=2 Tax=Giardia intestinalis TaxID=5741 RepID=A0A132NVK4_GIAIN|nr:Vacuolar biogenesis protein END1 [Giardia intestinalis]KWX14101.1 Vacuolar biogenesis protein END1 [Giardia intestinalis assemblage B]
MSIFLINWSVYSETVQSLQNEYTPTDVFGGPVCILISVAIYFSLSSIVNVIQSTYRN